MAGGHGANSNAEAHLTVAPGTLFMMSAYPKNERDDLSPDQRKAILAAIDSIKGGPPP